MPLVSVLLPVYNGGPYLVPAIESILGQTFGDFELLVLDDGSTDRSRQVAERYARSDTRVHVLARENRGLVITLNELVARARGELLARMDADDIALPDRLQRQVDFLRQQPGVVCVGGSYRLIDDAGRYIVTTYALEADADIQREALKGHTTICHPTAMIRREAMLTAGGYRPNFYPTEDLDLWLRLGEVGLLANLREPVLAYRMHPGSISGQAAQGRQRAAAQRCCEDAWRRRGISDIQFDASAAWRPTADRQSRQQFLLRWGWWAFNSGERRTSLVYACKALGAGLKDRSAWALLIKSLLKPRPDRVAQRKDRS